MSHKPKTVLIVDEDEGMRDTLTAILKRDYRVLRVSSGEAALPILNREDVDLMLLDVRLPGISGFEVLRIVKENYSLIEVLMISAITEIETAVQAMKHGAYHYITKDFDYDQLRSLVRNASERQDLNRQVLTLSAQVADQGDREFIVGPSKMTRDIVDLVHKIAKLSATVLILGESGTGKELLARLIHREAGDPDAPFIAVNLAAIPRELVESSLFGHERGAFTGAHRQQLGNLIERLVAVGDKDFILEEDLPLEFHFAQLEPQGTPTQSLFEDATNTFERNFILRSLEKCGWNVTGTAEYLGIPLSTLKYKMDKLDVRQLAKRLRGA